MAKSKISGCGCLGIGIVSLIVLGPILAFLEKAGWFLALMALAALIGAIYFRIQSKKEKLAELQRFTEGPGGTAQFIVFDTETSGLHPEDGA